MSKPQKSGPAYAIQEILFPGAGFPAQLYIERAEESAGTGDGWQMAKGDVLSGCTYFNSFYPAFWQKFTDIREVGLEFRFRGHLILRLTGVDADHRHHQIAEFELKSPAKGGFSEERGWFHSLPEGGETLGYVRLYFQLVALEQSEIEAAAYITDRPPFRDITLSIGICTFNRESHLSETLAALTRQMQKDSRIRQVWVVNQGAEFTDETLLKTLASPAITLIEQANLGGCGGFNRTMFEAVSAEDPATHHLLMDDDIRIDPRVIPRAIRFLEYCRDDVAVGGQMLEMQDPTRLTEAGAKLNYFVMLQSIGRGRDLANIGALALFDEAYEIDYNAWWFCMMPLDAIREAGHSAPIFIHGDDIEYGVRLKKRGLETVPLPGVGVWHETFAFKNNDWMLYYDLRNRLVNAVQHGDIATQPDALYVLGFIMNFTLAHRYRAGRVAALAVRDFLAGPDEALGPDAETRHQKLTAFAGLGPAPPVLTDISGFTTTPAALPPQDFKTPDTVFLFIKNFFRLSFGLGRNGKTVRFAKAWTHPKSIGGSDYLLPTSAALESYLHYQPSRLWLWRQTGHALWLALRYLISRRAANRRWRAALPELQSRAYWARIFGETSD